MTRTRKMNADALAAPVLSLLLPCAPTPWQVGAAKAQVGGVKGSAVAASASLSPASSSVGARTGRVRNRKSFGQLPASFELNAGQADARVKFLSRGSRHTLLLGADGALLALRTGSEEREGAVAVPRRRVRGETASDASGHAPSLQLLRMKFVGANPPVSALGYRFRLLQLDPEPPHGLQSPPFQALLLVERE